jgi:hypothetical protein
MLRMGSRVASDKATTTWSFRWVTALAALTFIVGSPAEVLAGATASERVALAGEPSLVGATDTSQWSPPSPDPSGIEYHPASGDLLVADAEVEETPLYAGANVFRSTTSGGLEDTSNTMAFSNEPAGTAVNPTNGHVFFSDDGKDRVFEVHIGPDGEYGSADDAVTSFSTRPFGSTDPEGVAFGAGKLYISDGVGAEVYVIDPGPNGVFDGVSEGGDDLMAHWDTLSLGQPDPEGIAFNGDLTTLFIVSHVARSDVTEVTPQGTLVEQIELSFLGTRSPGGLAYGPGSVDPSGRVLYLADRGRDSGPNVTNNDGAIFEISLGRVVTTPMLLLKASRRRVERGDRARLVARIIPCTGYEGELVEFHRRGRKIATKASSAGCVARKRFRIWRASSFRAAHPELGYSNRVTIRIRKPNRASS